MYSRGFGNGIDSDGVLNEVERRYEENNAESVPTVRRCDEAPPEKRGGFDLKRFFGGISLEDLLLVAIGILLLLDGEPDNDILVIAIVLLLFF